MPACMDNRVFHTHQQSGKEIERVRECERVPPLLCMPLLQVDSLLSARHSVPMANCSPASRAGAFAHDSTTRPKRANHANQAPFEASSGLQPHSAGGPDRQVKSPLGLARICPQKAAHVEEAWSTAGRAEHARPDESRRRGTPQVLETWWSQRSPLLQKQKEVDRKTHPFLLLPSLHEYPLGFTIHVLCSLIFVDRTQAM
jgi:hypothetical protein